MLDQIKKTLGKRMAEIEATPMPRDPYQHALQSGIYRGLKEARDLIADALASGALSQRVTRGRGSAMSGAWRWFSTDAQPVPTRVWCPKVGFPHVDADGRTQFDNTHFDSELDAWENGQRSVDVGVSLAERDVRSCREALARAERILAERTREREAFCNARTRSEVGDGQS